MAPTRYTEAAADGCRPASSRLLRIAEDQHFSWRGLPAWPRGIADGGLALDTGGGFLLKFSGHSDDRRDVSHGRAIGNVLYRELLAPPEHSGGITVSLARSGHA